MLVAFKAYADELYNENNRLLAEQFIMILLRVKADRTIWVATTGQVSSVDAYIKSRQSSGCVLPCFELIDISEHVHIPSDICDADAL